MKLLFENECYYEIGKNGNGYLKLKISLKICVTLTKYLWSIQKHSCVSFYLLGTPPRKAKIHVWERFPNPSASKEGWKQMSKE